MGSSYGTVLTQQVFGSLYSSTVLEGCSTLSLERPPALDLASGLASETDVNKKPRAVVL